MIDVGLVPKSFFKVFGCNHCEWKNRKECLGPFDAGLCDARQAWLVSFLPDYEKKPTLDRVRLDFNKALGSDRMLKTSYLLSSLESQKEVTEKKLDECKDSKELAQLRKVLNMLDDNIERNQRNFQKMWATLTSISDVQVGREMPKKIETTHEHIIRPSDIRRMMVDITPKLKKLEGEKGE